MDKVDIYRELEMFKKDAHTAISSKYISMRELKKFYMVLESEYHKYMTEVHPPIVGILRDIEIQLGELKEKIQRLEDDTTH